MVLWCFMTRNLPCNDSIALDNLLLYLPFDEINGSIAYDISGNGHHGRQLIKPVGQKENPGVVF